MSAFERSVRKLLKIEGDFSDHPADSGGKTRWGVTEYWWRLYGYQGDIRDAPVDLGLRIYREQFWDRLLLDQVDALSPHIADEMFDTEVNTPAGTAAVFLQRALNALNRGERDHPDVKVDGRIGPATLGALRAFLAARGRMGETVLLRALNCMQGNYYIELAERRHKDEAFVLGWLANRVRIEGER